MGDRMPVPMFTKMMALKKTSLMYVCMHELKCHETRAWEERHAFMLQMPF